jgi:hypothetical protein
MSKEHTPPKHEERPKEPSLENVRVSILAEPQKHAPNGKMHSERIALRLKVEVEAAITAAAPAGLRAQFAAVQDVVKSTSQKIDPNAIDTLKVLIQAVQGDAKYYREYHATPPRVSGN